MSEISELVVKLLSSQALLCSLKNSFPNTIFNQNKIADMGRNCIAVFYSLSMHNIKIPAMIWKDCKK
jgi:hypothetical protein